jgi:hypothetical protein
MQEAISALVSFSCQPAHYKGITCATQTCASFIDVIKRDMTFGGFNSFRAWNSECFWTLNAFVLL